MVSSITRNNQAREAKVKKSYSLTPWVIGALGAAALYFGIKSYDSISNQSGRVPEINIVNPINSNITIVKGSKDSKVIINSPYGIMSNSKSINYTDCISQQHKSSHKVPKGVVLRPLRSKPADVKPSEFNPKSIDDCMDSTDLWQNPVLLKGLDNAASENKDYKMR